jgi:hypothetical protein
VNVENLIAIFADEMLMLGDKRVEMLSPTDSHHLQPSLAYKFLKVSVNRSQTDVGERTAHF